MNIAVAKLNNKFINNFVTLVTNYYQYIHMHKTTPQILRTKTQGSVPHKMKTSSPFVGSLSTAPHQISQCYADLVVQSVKKNYLVGNIKPFAVNNLLFNQVQEQVKQIKQVHQNIQYHKVKDNATVSEKLNKLLSKALKTKNRKLKRSIKNENYIKSAVQDEHQILREDFQEQLKVQRSKRRKTISEINNSLLHQYSSLVEGNMLRNKNKLLHFKKQRKVVTRYSDQQDLSKLDAIRNYSKNILNFKKDDYGIYSRSANKALYYMENSKKQDSICPQPQNSNKTASSFYSKYFGSYSQRKNILRMSQKSVKL